MSLRMIAIAALVAAPLALSPNAADAQRGPERGAAASAASNASNGTENGRAVGRPMGLPPGITNNFPGGALPPGLARTREMTPPPAPPAPEPPPAEEPPAEEPPTEECPFELVLVDGRMMAKDCNGNLIDIFGGM